MIDARRVDFVALPVSDLARADAFYGETVGLWRNPHTSGEKWVEYETGNLTLGLSMYGGSIAFGVDDVEARRTKLEEAGVEFPGDYDVGHRNVGIEVSGPGGRRDSQRGLPPRPRRCGPSRSAPPPARSSARPRSCSSATGPTRYRVECWRSFATYVHGFLCEAARIHARREADR